MSFKYAYGCVLLRFFWLCHYTYINHSPIFSIFFLTKDIRCPGTIEVTLYDMGKNWPVPNPNKTQQSTAVFLECKQFFIVNDGASDSDIIFECEMQVWHLLAIVSIGTTCNCHEITVIYLDTLWRSLQHKGERRQNGIFQWKHSAVTFGSTTLQTEVQSNCKCCCLYAK